MKPTLALDIGGTSLRAALIVGSRVMERQETPTPRPATPAAVLEAVTTLAAPLVARAGRVGVACAGAVTGGRVTATASATFPGWTDVPLAQTLGSVLGKPVGLLNDARAAAWGEARVGAGVGVSEFMFVTVSTGVGAGLILGGRLHQAGNGLDAELGFTFLPSAPGAGFLHPQLGPLEALEHQSSGTALGRAAQALGLPDPRTLMDRAAQGDARARLSVQRGAAQLAWKCADVAALLGVTRVALGGSVGLRPEYLEDVRAALALFPERFRPVLVAAQLGADAGLIGAALWAQSLPGPS